MTMNGTINRFDTSSLAQLNRALIGFDRIFNNFENRFASQTSNYPPYNVLKHDDHHYEIELAVAGFDKNDITVEVNQNELIIRGNKSQEEDPSKYVHRGLAARSFERVFTLMEHHVVQDAEVINGMLKIKIDVIVPEELKPRLISIK
jgi:molecular chaperone IbpA